MKNLVVRNATIKIVAAALTVGFVFSTSALQAQEKDLKSELYSDFDKIEDALWNEPSQEILMGLIDEESANVERLAKEGLKALDALLEIMDSPSTRFSNNAKMVAMCVAVKVIKEEEVIQAWEASVLGSTTSVRSKLDSLEGILTNRIVQFQDSKILEKFLTNLSGPNAEIQAASIHYLKNMILGLNAQKMRFSFTKDAKAANPIRALVNDPRLQVRRDALFVLALAGDESDFEFIAEKMADPNYDLEAKISIPTLLAMINSEKAFDPIKKLLEAKDANGGSSPELLRVQCIAGLSQCTTETVGDMVEVENAERVDELRELFTKIFVSGKEYRLRYAALQALSAPPFLTDENLENLLDIAMAAMQDETASQGFRVRVMNQYAILLGTSKDPEVLIKKIGEKMKAEQAKKLPAVEEKK